MKPALSILFLCSFPCSEGACYTMKFCAPKISMNPSWGVSLGGNATLKCSCTDCSSAVDFYLKKDGQSVSYARDSRWATFPITNVSRVHIGVYTCYSYYSEAQLWSEPSEPWELLITDPHLPRPKISVSPHRIVRVRTKISIQCWVRGPRKRFYFHMKKFQEPLVVDTDEDLATFHIPHVSGYHVGNYSCSYRPLPGLFISSKTSNNVELLVLDPQLPRPTISLSSTDGVANGENVTLCCQWEMMPLFMETKFLITNASWKHGGDYTCHYSHDWLISQHSNPVALLIRDPELPRPNISLDPNRMALLGSNVTIQCWAKGPIQTFYLHKDGNLMEAEAVEPDRNTATFSISNVSWDHGGRYRCTYKPQSGLPTSSETSDTLELLLLDPILPRPTISMIPSALVVLGGQVTIQCAINEGPANFYLQKIGDPTPKKPMKSDFDMGEFSIISVSWEHQGNYTCSYAYVTKPFVFSAHSDPVQLLLSEITEDTPDYTQLNIIRFATGGLILHLLACIVVAEWCFCRNGRGFEGKALDPANRLTGTPPLETEDHIA